MAPGFTEFLFIFLQTRIAMATLCFDFLQTWGIQLIAQQQIYSFLQALGVWIIMRFFLENISCRACSGFDIVSNCLASGIKWEKLERWRSGGAANKAKRSRCLCQHIHHIYFKGVDSSRKSWVWGNVLLNENTGKLLHSQTARYAILTWNSLHCDNCVCIQLGQCF